MPEEYTDLMVGTLSLSVWKKFAEECWRNALIGMGKEIRKSCWESVSALKLIDKPNDCLIIADRRFDMHLTMPFSGVAHITSNKPKRVWRRLLGISIHNVWWLGPDLLLKLFEGCEREKIS